MPILNHVQLKNTCVAILTALKVPPEEADTVADNLVKANLKGIDSHGVFRLREYVRKVENGTIIPGATIKVVRETASTMLLDGGSGFGQVVGVKAMTIAIKKAREEGIGVVSVRNSNHFGIAAYYTLLAAEQDMIGIVMCNGTSLVAPWGGRTPILGTNPISFAVPAGGAKPIVLDMATSASARAKILLAKEIGEGIPEGWAVDEAGRPTTDPDAALRGAQLPFGGYKGYGLALMIDILSGALSGSACGRDVKSLLQLDEPSNLGQLYIAINIDAFVPRESFKEKVDKLIKDIKSCQPAAGFKEVLIPGELEFREEEKRFKHGIPLSEEEWRTIQELAETLGVNLESFIPEANSRQYS